MSTKTKRIWIITLFPQMFDSFFQNGIISKIFFEERNLGLSFHTVDLKKFSPKNFKGVDDTSYGGGPGLVIRPDVLLAALNGNGGIVEQGQYDSLDKLRNESYIIYPNPRGTPWNSEAAKNMGHKLLSENKDLIFICGRYEGIDERFVTKFVDYEFSLGDFVLTGGEIPVMAMMDSLLRFIPGVLGNSLSAQEDSFEDNLLDHPHYTKPQIFEGMKVPEVLLSGNHKEIALYRLNEKKRLTQLYRPELIFKKNKKESQ